MSCEELGLLGKCFGGQCIAGECVCSWPMGGIGDLSNSNISCHVHIYAICVAYVVGGLYHVLSLPIHLQRVHRAFVSAKALRVQPAGNDKGPMTKRMAKRRKKMFFRCRGEKSAWGSRFWTAYFKGGAMAKYNASCFLCCCLGLALSLVNILAVVRQEPLPAFGVHVGVSVIHATLQCTVIMSITDRT